MRRVFPLFLLLGIAAIAACGGGGGAAGSIQPKVPSGSTSAAVKVFVPSKTGQAKRAQAIVAGTNSVRIRIYTVGGATPVPQPADTVAVIGPTAPGCSVVSGGTQCTIVVTGVPISSAVVFEILSYASADGTGTPLASGFVTVDTTQATITPPPVALGGVVNTLTLSPATLASPVASSGPTQFTFTVTAKDASGNIILPPGTFSPSIFFSASNDPNGAISFSPNPLSIPSSTGVNTVTITFDSTKKFTGTSTITATADTVTGTLSFAPTGSGGGITAGYRIFEYSLPSGTSSKPWAITNGPDGKSLWFTEQGTNKIGVLFPSTCTQTAPLTCKIIEGAIGHSISPTGIAAAQDGTVWFGGATSTATGGTFSIQSGTCSSSSQTSLSCTVTQEPDPVSSPSYNQILRESYDGRLEFAAKSSGLGGYLGLVNVSTNPVTTNSVSVGSKSLPFGIAENAWSTDPGDNLIIGPPGCSDCGLYAYAFQTGGQPQGIVNVAGGDIVVADAANDALDYFEPDLCTTGYTYAPGSCTYNAVSTPTKPSQPEFLTVGPDGNVWFTEATGNNIGVLVMSNMSVSEIPVPTTNAKPWGIVLGPDGNVWFTEYNTGKIGVVVP